MCFSLCVVVSCVLLVVSCVLLCVAVSLVCCLLSGDSWRLVVVVCRLMVVVEC